jgi:hypothetical protein
MFPPLMLKNILLKKKKKEQITENSEKTNPQGMDQKAGKPVFESSHPEQERLSFSET